MAQKFRSRLARHKRPVEAMQYTGRWASKIGLWAKASEWEDDFLGADLLLTIDGDVLTVARDHWVVRDAFGLFIAVDPDTFDATYEAVTE